MFASTYFLPIVVAGLAAFFFGFLVHGPLFGKVWIGLMKITPAEMEKGKKEMQKRMLPTMLVALLQQIVTAFVLAQFVQGFDMDVVQSLWLSLFFWLGFIAMPLLNGVLWERRSIPLYLFNIAYQFGGLALMAIILALWK